MALAVIGLFALGSLRSQSTIIRGFVEARTTYANDRVFFGLGEQDLFITSELSERVSFLGETVFKFEHESPTDFAVSVERIIVKYNFRGNHNILLGKHHTPINYWNDTYHHGRLFFPTIDRPLLFARNIIPLHTMGISLQGHSFGKLRFGYDLMIGNGIGSSDVMDNNNRKSVTAAIHIKPADRLRIGASFYSDRISPGESHHGSTDHETEQTLLTGSVAYFGRKFEVLTEGTFGFNTTDESGKTNAVAAYFYGGYKLTDKFTPYFRVDLLSFEDEELYYDVNDAKVFVLGARYEINFLTVIKLEFQHQDTEIEGIGNRVTAQVAVGF